MCKRERARARARDRNAPVCENATTSEARQLSGIRRGRLVGHRRVEGSPSTFLSQEFLEASQKSDGVLSKYVCATFAK